MKTTTKIILMTMVTSVLFLMACSRTKDAIGADSIENLVSVIEWKSVITADGTDLVPFGGYAKFKKNDHQIHYYEAGGTQVKTDSYAFNNGSKRMTWNGVEYEIQENFAASSKTLTLIDPTTKKAVVIFFRERQG
ncbi:hypothetical protein [Niabella hirudinis]|uniref:hypothetical protein n=1 Tax=Niabella hirudinis TaxID=1285929 RepID=UPI003EBB6540